MPTLTARRFTFAPYAGPKSKITCPACDKPRCFTPYLDTSTGELLPIEYGCCAHKSSCGYMRNPYIRPAGGGLSYATAIERSERLPYAAMPPRQRPPLAAAKPPVLFPAELYRASLGYYERNNLARLLREHFGWGVAGELLRRFHLGTSAYWPGACVFWLIDEQGRVRGGQVVHFDETGHTVKVPQPGKADPKRRTSWVHIALAEGYQRRHQQVPDWLTAYAASDNPKSPCLFGLPQLATAPAGQPVAIVESAKTAMLVTSYYPRYLWLATGSKYQLTPDRLEPLRGRRIVLFPDAGAYDDWQTRATSLRELGFDVTISAEMEQVAAEDPTLRKGDLADVLLREWPGYPPDWDE